MNNPTRPAWGVQGGLIPRGPLALPVTVTWSIATQELDFIKELEQGVIDFVQCIYIDNRDNPNPVLITVQVTGQRILAAAASQGTYPLYGIGGLKLTVESTVGEVSTKLLLLNFPQPYYSWGPSTGGGGSGGFPLQVSTASVTSVASAAADTVLLAANVNRRGVIIVNTDANALYVMYGAPATTAGGGFVVIIPSNGYWEMPTPIYTGALNGIWAANGAGLAAITEL